MKNRALFLQVALLYLTAHYLDICWGQTTTYYLYYPSDFKRTVKLSYDSFDSSIILKASAVDYPLSGENYLTVEIPQAYLNTYRVWGTVRNFSIRNKDQLTIVSTNGSFNKTIYDSRYYDRIPSTFYAGGIGDIYDQALIFYLKLAGVERLKGFEITLTAAKYCYAEINRAYDDFYCSNNYCIKEVLKCNGRNNCGNNRDETAMSCYKASIIGYSIGVFLLFIVLISICVICCRRRRNNHATTLTTTTPILPPPPQGIVNQGYQLPVPPPTYAYNTNQNWQQFPDPNRPPPPPYQAVNSTYPQT